jgi:hypothetical protein
MIRVEKSILLHIISFFARRQCQYVAEYASQQCSTLYSIGYSYRIECKGFLQISYKAEAARGANAFEMKVIAVTKHPGQVWRLLRVHLGPTKLPKKSLTTTERTYTLESNPLNPTFWIESKF